MGSVKNTKQPLQRSLRIGVILGGKIIEERLVRQRDPITIGQSAKNTFSVPIEDLPHQWSLFLVEGGKYQLHFSDAMDGRISDGSQVKPLAGLKSSNAKKRGNGWVMTLPETARGKIVVGEMTLLFQFVTAPPLQPRPRLPASVRGSLADRIDPQLSIILAISLIAHLSLAIYAHSRDRVLTRAERTYQETFQDKTIVTKADFAKPKLANPEVKPDKPVPTKKPVAKPPKRTTPKKPRVTPRKTDPKPASGPPAGKPGPSSAQVKKDVTRRVNNLLGSAFSDTGRPGGMNSKSPGDDLSRVAKDIRKRGDKVALGGGTNRGPKSAGKARTGKVTGTSVSGPGGTQNAGPKVEREIKSRARLSRPTASDSTSLTPDAVMRKINSVYRRQLQACHKKLLKKNPTAGGKVRLRFTVGASGRVTRAAVKGFDPGVNSCIKSRVTGWRFPPPKEEGAATDATFTLSLQLQAQ